LSTAQAVYDLLHEPEVRWGLEAWQAQSWFIWFFDKFRGYKHF
jgi:hypothetical protein